MDPISIGAIAALVLSKALDKGVDKAADATANSAEGAIARLLGWVRSRGGLEPALERLEEAPDSPRRAEEVAAAIDAYVEDDPAGLSELQGIVNDINRITAEGDVYQIGSITANTGGIAVGRNEGGITTSNPRGTPTQGFGSPGGSQDKGQE